jgi:hypothetical protein
MRADQNDPPHPKIRTTPVRAVRRGQLTRSIHAAKKLPERVTRSVIFPLCASFALFFPY